MTDEALRRAQAESSGNLSNVPLHMADVGTENYDQEFTLGLIENEQADARSGADGPRPHRRGYVRNVRGVQGTDRQAEASGAAVHALLHQCAGNWRELERDGNDAGGILARNGSEFGSAPRLSAVGLGLDLVLEARAGRDGVRPDDQVGHLRSDRTAAVAALIARGPNILELHTSYNPGSALGPGPDRSE